jgi:hypothetical protein
LYKHSESSQRGGNTYSPKQSISGSDGGISADFGATVVVVLIDTLVDFLVGFGVVVNLGVVSLLVDLEPSIISFVVFFI